MPHLLELFSGTGSIGKVFAAAGWMVTSVDLEPRFNPTLCMNVLDLEPSMIDGPVDLLWGSPPCTHYSKARTRAKTPRDLVGSDRLVQKVLDLAAHYQCPFFMENPQGLLMHRDVVRGISMRLIDYCMYADDRFPVFYRKRTCIWSNTNWCPKRPLCNKQCRGCDEGGRHIQRANGQPTVTREGRRYEGHRREQLYAIPPSLPEELLAFVTRQ